LGLTISRDLARLLGGQHQRHEHTWRRQHFHFDAAVGVPAERSAACQSNDTRAGRAASPPEHIPTKRNRAYAVPFRAAVNSANRRPDDSQHLKSDSRLILIVEDDPAFATILRDMAHEQGFQCIVTHTANDALAAVATYRPKAILLDMNLPDYSGLGVLDQLKRKPTDAPYPGTCRVGRRLLAASARHGCRWLRHETRETRAAREALERLEAKFSQGVRNVLVVEDDDRQRESIRQLLENEDVHITAVCTAADALGQLRKLTFDCMVMDLNLPDLSGSELLAKMAQADEVSFPPVIVYTGRTLTGEEEQGLRRFSKSIIIKDARSPSGCWTR